MAKNLSKAIFSFLTAAVLLGCSPKIQKIEYITIGALLPLTGEGADEGLRAFNGLHLAKKEINEKGGIQHGSNSGKLLDIIVLNDRGDEEYVMEQYNKLIEKGVVAIIGSSYSDVTLALAKAAERDGIPIITPTATNPDITLGRRNVFRAIFTNDYQAEVMAYFAYNSLRARTALVLADDDFAGNKNITDVFSEQFKKYGGTVIATEHFSSDAEFPAILGKYSNRRPDIIFCPDYYLPAARLVNAVQTAGFNNTYLLGSDGWDGLLPYIANPGAVKNIFYTSTFSPDDKDEKVANFTRNHFNTFAQMPMSGTAAAYSSVYIIAEAINLTGNTSKDVMIIAIKANQLDMITGKIVFDQNNNPRTNVYIIRIDGGVYSTYEKLSL
jgi:branched-chain amino acid transport system substrate-binding protein